MNMNWWNIVKSTPRSRREKKEVQQWIEDFKNEINQKHKFSEPEGLNDTTDAWGDPLRSGYGDVFNERQLASRRHKLGREHDFKEQESEHSDDSGQMRDRVRAIADKQLPKEHGVARRNMRLKDATNNGGASDEPTRGKKFDEEAGSEQPTLDVEHSRSMHHRPTDDDGSPGRLQDLRPKDVDNSDRRHPLNPWNWYNTEDEVPKEAQTAIDTNMQRRKDNQRKDLWVDTQFGQRQEW